MNDPTWIWMLVFVMVFSQLTTQMTLQFRSLNRRVTLIETTHQHTKAVVRLLVERLDESSDGGFAELLDLCGNQSQQQAEELLAQFDAMQNAGKKEDAVRLLHSKLNQSDDQTHETYELLCDSRWGWLWGLSKVPRSEKLTFIESLLWTATVRQHIAPIA